MYYRLRQVRKKPNDKFKVSKKYCYIISQITFFVNTKPEKINSAKGRNSLFVGKLFIDHHVGTESEQAGDAGEHNDETSFEAGIFAGALATFFGATGFFSFGGFGGFLCCRHKNLL